MYASIEEVGGKGEESRGAGGREGEGDKGER